MVLRGFSNGDSTPTQGFFCNPHNGGHTWTLPSILGALLEQAEILYGERDRTWTILGVEISSNPGPQIWYPEHGKGLKNVLVQLGAGAAVDRSLAIYQLAHEVIHLLSPSGGRNANVLEEGLATAFSEDIVAQERLVIHTSDPKYTAAANLARQFLSRDSDIVRKIRAIKPAMFTITPDFLLKTAPWIERDLAEKLCVQFSDFEGF